MQFSGIKDVYMPPYFFLAPYTVLVCDFSRRSTSRGGVTRNSVGIVCQGAPSPEHFQQLVFFELTHTHTHTVGSEAEPELPTHQPL